MHHLSNFLGAFLSSCPSLFALHFGEPWVTTARIIFIARQEISRNIEPSPFLIIGQSSWHPCGQHILQKPLPYNVPKMSVRIDYTAPNLMPTSLAMFCRSRLLSHITRMCTTLNFHQSWHPWGGQAVHHPQRSKQTSSQGFAQNPLFLILWQNNCPSHLVKTWRIIKQYFDCKLSKNLLHFKPLWNIADIFILYNNSRCIE